jgi:hypothetical protein
MTILSNHRLHSYKATASSHRRVLTPKKTPHTPFKQTIRRRITIQFPITEKTSTITKKTLENKTVATQEPCEDQKPQNLSIEGMNIYEDLYGGWHPEFYEALNHEYDLDNSFEYEDELTEALNEEMWDHLDYLEWLTD